MKKEHKTVKRHGEKSTITHSARPAYPNSSMHPSPSLKVVWSMLMESKMSLLYILIIDIAFVIAAFYFRRFVELLAPSLSPEALVANFTLALYGLALIVVYYLLVLLLYSFAKFFILTLIKGMKSPDPVQFERFLPFYGLNVMLMGIFFAIMLSIAYIFAALKQPYEIAGFMFLVIPYLLMLFVVLNLSHSMFFARNEGAWKSISSGFKFAFGSMKKYGFVIGWNVVFALIFVIVLFIPGLLIRSFAESPALYASMYEYFTMFTSAFSMVMIYVMALFSRTAFYLIAEAKDDSSS